MPTYLVLPAILLALPFTISAVVVIFALMKCSKVAASFGSRRFSFTLSASDGPAVSHPPVLAATPSVPDTPSVPTLPVSGMPDQPTSALAPRAIPATRASSVGD
jgi:hypothetical protein